MRELHGRELIPHLSYCAEKERTHLNSQVRELHGMELIPHLSYWKQLPGLVKDGCVFSRGQSCKAYAWACERAYAWA